MSLFDWTNCNGYFWSDDSTTFKMTGTTPSTGTPTLTLGNLTPQDDDFTIDWGDGNVECFTSAISGLIKVHTYADNDTEYTISISGAEVTATGIEYVFADWTSSWITSVDSWGEGFFTTSLKSAFQDCSSLVSLPSSWTGLESVTNFTYAFAFCTNLVTIPSSWGGLESVTSFSYAFRNCTSLISLPNSWTGLESVTNFTYAFYYCSSIISLPSSWTGLESVTSFYYAFYYCSSLVSLPSSWVGLENVTSFSSAFRGCTSLVIIGTTDYESLSNVTDCSSMFNGSAQITSDILALYNQLVTTATSFDDCFTGLTLAENYASIPDSWKGL